MMSASRPDLPGDSPLSASKPPDVPIIDIGPLITGAGHRTLVAPEIERACRNSGFFYIENHGVDERLQQRLEALSRDFFALDLEAKMQIHMERGGRAWRGYFPVGGELTAGRPDRKEGIYFGAELPEDDLRVLRGTPLHGPNLFPPHMPEFRETVLEYMDAMTSLGHRVMAGVAMSLGLADDYFDERYTREPLILFRIFNYPAGSGVIMNEPEWGVGEHTDYGLLTILKQDATGGLQVKSQGRWVAAPPLAGTFLCNIGDMLDRLTRGLYRSTPHRVQNITRRDRLSFPFFFDPHFEAEVRPIEGLESTRAAADRRERWDGASLDDLRGTYGDYVLGKVSKVFPQLRRKVL